MTDERNPRAIEQANAKKRKAIFSGIALTIVAIIIAIGWLVGQPSSPEPKNTPTPEPQTVSRQPEPLIPAPASEEPTLPTAAEIIEQAPEPLPPIVEAPQALDNSDSVVLSAIMDINPTLAQWFIPNEQIRKWILTIDLIADGKLPRRYRPVDYPVEKFIITQNDNEHLADETLMSEDNYARMQLLIDNIISIEPAKLARYYQQWLPILETAYQELGKKDQLDQRINLAISQILLAEPLTEQPQLERPSVLYRFTDESLESANDVEKILWRMGPQNSENIQGFLRELRFHLEQ
jgi:hypothetical protein